MCLNSQLTSFLATVSNNKAGKDAQGHQTTHGYAGVPGREFGPTATRAEFDRADITST